MSTAPFNSELPWSYATELNGIGVWEWNLLSESIRCSPVWWSRRGVVQPNSSLEADVLLSDIHPEDRQKVEAHRSQLLAGDLYESIFEYRLQSSDDSCMWIEERIHAMLGEDGKVVQLVGCETDVSSTKSSRSSKNDSDGNPKQTFGLNLDVTERREVEQSLRDAKNLLQRITENIPGVVFRFMQHSDGSLSILYISKQVEEFYDVSVADALEDVTPLFDATHEDDLDGLLKAIRISAENLTMFLEEYRLDVQEKDLRWVRTICKPYRTEEGDTIWDGVLIDITDRKKTEHDTIEAKNRIDRVNENLPGMLWSFLFPANGEPRCTFITSKCEQMYGVSVEQALEDPNCLASWQPPEFNLQVVEDIQRSVANLKPLKTELRVDPPGQEHRWHQVYGQPRKQSNGDVILDGVTLDVTDRKEAEQALKEAEDRFRRMTENIPGTVYQHIERTDGSNAALYVSQKVQDLFGVSVEQALQDVNIVFDAIHPDDVDGLLKALEETAKTLQPINNEYRTVVSGQGVKWLKDISQPSRTEEGHTIWDGVVIDISDRKNAELELLEAKQQIDRITDNLPGMVFRHIYQPTGGYQCIYISSRCQEMFGVSVEQALDDATTLLKWIEPSVIEFLNAEINAAIAKKIPLFTEYRVNPPGELSRWYQVNALPTLLTNGNIALDGVVLDVTDRKRAELALEESQETFRHMTENVPGMIYQYMLTSDGEAKVIYASSQSQEIYGLTPQELIEEPRRCISIIHPDDLDAVAAGIHQSAESLEQYRMEYRVILPMLGEQWRQATALPRRNDAGDTIWDGVVIDITDRKKSEIQLRRANDELAKATKLKNEFLATVSHEVRTPLTAILGMAEGMENEIFGPLTDRQRDSLRVIEQSGNHLLEVINDVLDLAMIESGQTLLELSEIDVKSLSLAAVEIIKPQASKKSISLNANIAIDLPRLNADERRIRQVLLNLLTNAVKFTHVGGVVSLIAEFVEENEQGSQSRIIFHVADTGIGIDASEFATLFEPFCRVTNISSNRDEGTGLGLAVVKKYANLHGGDVRVTSQVGVGSTFTVELPICGPNDHIEVEYKPVDSIPSRKAFNTPPVLDVTSVLLVEDNEAVAASMVAYLEGTNHKVKVVDDGLTAIEIAQETDPNVILMDIQLPGIDGLETIRRMRAYAALRETPIIALTGRAMPNDSERCLKAGANDYVSKPCSMESLAIRIRELSAGQ